MRNTERGRPLVYICTRYTGDTETNVKKARKHSGFAVDNGVVPLAPHGILLIMKRGDDLSA